MSLRAQVGVLEPYRLVSAAGATIAVSSRGAGPRVVCLHATGHGGRDFEALGEALKNDFEVLTLDWPGQGHSPADTTPASAKRYAEILEALLTQLDDRKGDPVVLIGCSIGGAAAIELAARRPDLLRALVLCNPGGLAPLDASARWFIGRMVAFFNAGVRGAPWFPRVFDYYYRLILSEPAALSQRRRIVASCLEIAPVLSEAWQSFAKEEADLRDKAARLGLPTFVAWAGKDRIVSWARSREGVTAIPEAKVEMFRASHAAFLETPAAFEKAFRVFFAKLEPPLS